MSAILILRIARLRLRLRKIPGTLVFFRSDLFLLLNLNLNLNLVLMIQLEWIKFRV